MKTAVMRPITIVKPLRTTDFRASVSSAAFSARKVWSAVTTEPPLGIVIPSRSNSGWSAAPIFGMSVGSASTNSTAALTTATMAAPMTTKAVTPVMTYVIATGIPRPLVGR